MRKTRLIHGSTALGAIASMGALLLAPAAEADPQAARSRSSASSSSSRASSSSGSSSVSRSSASSSSASRSSSRGAAVTRSSGRVPSSGRRTTVSGVSTHRSGGHGFGRGHGRYYYSPYYNPYYGYPYYGYYPYYPWGWSIGLGWWGGYFYGPYSSYHSPYHYYGPYRYSPYPAPETTRVQAEPVGAFDLNVKPKRTEVWVDGHYVGTTGRFDGFPDYLWLAEGKHQLIFYLEGHQTVEREVDSVAGVLVDLRIQMAEGRAIPPRQLAVKPPSPPARVPREPLTVSPGEEKAESKETAEAPAEGLDLRPAPGRLVLSIQPEDASVYLDGRYLGTGRDLARLHAGLLIDSGEHRLEVVRPGFEDRAVEFSVAAGEEERIEIGLERG